MIDTFFKVISYIFHPLFMPLLGLYFLFELETIPNSLYLYDAICFFPEEAKMHLYLVIGVLTFIAPLLSILIMQWNRMISSLHLSDKRERIYPIFIVTFYYILTFIFLKYQWLDKLQHPALLGFFFGMVVVNILFFFINFKIKISAHAAGVFGICGLLIGYNQTQFSRFVELEFPNLGFIICFVLISGLVTTGRLYQKAHSLQEVLLGMFIGFTTIYTCVKFGIYI